MLEKLGKGSKVCWLNQSSKFWLFVFYGIVVTSQIYAARVIHSNKKYDYIDVYKLY